MTAGAAAVPDAETVRAAHELLAREAGHLDAQAWDDWLALYTEDASFWMPAWTDEHRLSASPDRELSLMYCSARAGLEDRVWRVRSGLSAASEPLPRTCHQVTNSLVELLDGRPDALRVSSSWSCHVLRLKSRSQHLFFGRCEHRLRLEQGQWRIAGKTVVLMNDVIPTMLDFYCV